MYLLDTNIISDLARHPQGPVGRKLSEVDPGLVATSIIVACEIRFGLANRPDQRSAARSVEFLETMTILPLEADVSATYAAVRVTMMKRGLEMTPNDLLIAAHAMALDAVVVTDDRAFLGVPGLKTENWLRT